MSVAAQVGESWGEALAEGAQLPDHQRVRIVTRASMRYAVNLLTTLVEESQSDAIDVLMLLTLTTLNIAHLRNDAKLNERYSAPDSPTPLDLRKPARIEDLADMLRLPLEDARARVAGMIEAGVIVERNGGLVSDYESFDPEGAVRIARLNMAFTAQFVRELDKSGVSFGG